MWFSTCGFSDRTPLWTWGELTSHIHYYHLIQTHWDFRHDNEKTFSIWDVQIQMSDLMQDSSGWTSLSVNILGEVYRVHESFSVTKAAKCMISVSVSVNAMKDDVRHQNTFIKLSETTHTWIYCVVQSKCLSVSECPFHDPAWHHFTPSRSVIWTFCWLSSALE